MRFIRKKVEFNISNDFFFDYSAKVASSYEIDIYFLILFKATTLIFIIKVILKQRFSFLSNSTLIFYYIMQYKSSFDYY